MKDKIYYFQEKSNDVLDLQDEFTPEEIGIIFILKAAYFKYIGELKRDNLCQRCKFFGDKEKLMTVAKKIFEFQEDLLINNSWMSEINNIKERSEKRKAAADERWKKENKPKKTKGNPPKPTGFIPPTLQEVKDYCQEKNYKTDPEYFFNYYTTAEWKDNKDKPIKNWKLKLMTWESKNNPKPENSLCQEINTIAGSELLTKIEKAGNKAALHFAYEADYKELIALPESTRNKIKDKISKTLGTEGYEFIY